MSRAVAPSPRSGSPEPPSHSPCTSGGEACPHFYLTHGAKGRVGTDSPGVLRMLMKQDGVVNRCDLRGGVHLDASYVSDLCMTGQYHDCVFYEDEGA